MMAVHPQPGCASFQEKSLGLLFGLAFCLAWWSEIAVRRPITMAVGAAPFSAESQSGWAGSPRFSTLKGGGNFFLSDNANNSVAGFDTLTNVDNLIEGAGRITTDIVNQTHGTIEASSGG